jgi:hypothetical protein
MDARLEIRDTETALEAVRSGLNGHRVLATLPHDLDPVPVKFCGNSYVNMDVYVDMDVKDLTIL